MQFPYTVFSLGEGEKFFSLVARSIDEGTIATKPYGILGACFGIRLVVPGIRACFPIDLTLKSLFDFSCQLAHCYNCLEGEAMMISDDSSVGTIMKVSFDAKTGHVAIEGRLSMQGTNSKVSFEWKTDQSYMKPRVAVLQRFIDELADVQGFYDFPY